MTADERADAHHELNQERTEWLTESEKIWCLHRALQLNEPSDNKALLGNNETFWTEHETDKLRTLYFEKLKAL